jgi:hypothetical protein
MLFTLVTKIYITFNFIQSSAFIQYEGSEELKASFVVMDLQKKKNLSKKSCQKVFVC